MSLIWYKFFINSYCRLYRTSWENFCKLSYLDHQNPPTEETFLDYFKKKHASGRTGEYMFQCYQRLKTVYLQLYGQKFDSEKVKNLINEETGKERIEKSMEKSGICPHCGDVSFSNYVLLFLKTRIYFFLINQECSRKFVAWFQS